MCEENGSLALIGQLTLYQSEFCPSVNTDGRNEAEKN